VTALADIDDLTARLPAGTITEPARATQLLADVSAAVRRYTGQTFTAETTTERLKVRKNKVRLPQHPVTAVNSVKDLNAVDVPHVIVNNILELDTAVIDTWAWEPRRTGLGYVDVDYAHGYATLPDDLVGFVCQVAARVYGTPGTDGGVSQESLGAYSYQIGSAAAAGAIGFLPAERAWLDDFVFQLGVSYITQ
jgi:hypothetical protein